MKVGSIEREIHRSPEKTAEGKKPNRKIKYTRVAMIQAVNEMK